MLHVLLLLYLLLHAAVTLHVFPLRSFVAADRDWAGRVALPVANATTAPQGSVGVGDVLGCSARRRSRCCELPRRLPAAAAPIARDRFGAVRLRPIKPVGSSEDGLDVAAAAYQAGGRPLISAGSCAEGTCRPLLCPSQARAGRPPLPLAPKKQSARPSRPASSLSLGKAAGFRTTRLASQGAFACESGQPGPTRPQHLPPTAQQGPSDLLGRAGREEQPSWGSDRPPYPGDTHVAAA